MLIAQITDCHIVEPGRLLQDRVDTAAMLAAAVAYIETMTPRPDVVIATGDLVDSGTAAQYANLMSILDRLTIPILAIPGNHDDRALLRDAFGLAAPAGRSAPVHVVNNDHPVRLVGLDTTIPGEHPGRVDAEHMSWLDTELSIAPDKPTLVFQHHPPFLTGIDWMDRSGLEGSELEAEVVSRHPQVQAIVCGHVHRIVQATVGGVRASTWPSTGAQVALALDGTPYGYVDEPGAVALHRWTAGSGLVSHVNLIGGPDPWIPAWAADRD